MRKHKQVLYIISLALLGGCQSDKTATYSSKYKSEKLFMECTAESRAESLRPDEPLWLYTMKRPVYYRHYVLPNSTEQEANEFTKSLQVIGNNICASYQKNSSMVALSAIHPRGAMCKPGDIVEVGFVCGWRE